MRAPGPSRAWSGRGPSARDMTASFPAAKWQSNRPLALLGSRRSRLQDARRCCSAIGERQRRRGRATCRWRRPLRPVLCTNNPLTPARAKCLPICRLEAHQLALTLPFESGGSSRNRRVLPVLAGNATRRPISGTTRFRYERVAGTSVVQWTWLVFACNGEAAGRTVAGAPMPASGSHDPG